MSETGGKGGKDQRQKDKLKRNFTLSLRLNAPQVLHIDADFAQCECTFSANEPFIKNAYLLMYLINTAKICCVEKVLSDFTIVIREIEIKLKEEKNKHCYNFFSSL